MTARFACGVDDVAPEESLRVVLPSDSGQEVEVAVVRDSEGGWHAVSDICSHGQVSLSDGEVEGCVVECWLHGSQFDLNTGVPLQPPAVVPIPVYSLTLDGDRVLVDVDVTR